MGFGHTVWPLCKGDECPKVDPMSTFAKPPPVPKRNARPARQPGKTSVVSDRLFGQPFTVAPRDSADEVDARNVAREAVASSRPDLDPQVAGPIANSTAPREITAGLPLDPLTRTWANRRLGCDFADVRIHTGTLADDLTRSFGANAATIGNHIFFRTGRYRPNDPQGKQTLAHELWHTRQLSEGKPRLRLERASDFNELTVIDSRFSSYFDRALEGAYIDECEIRALGYDLVIDLHEAAKAARDQQAMVGTAASTAYSRLHELAELAYRVSLTFDDEALTSRCSLVQGPVLDSPRPKRSTTKHSAPKPANHSAPKPKDHTLRPQVQVGRAPRTPAPAPSQVPQSHVSDHHLIVYKHVREGKIPPFESVHRIVLYERAGISWGFADQLIEIAQQSYGAKLAAFWVLQGLVDVGYDEYAYKIHRFVDEDLMSYQEIAAQARSAPDWYNPDIQERIIDALGGEDLAVLELGEAEPHAPSGKRARRIDLGSFKSLSGSGTIELTSFSQAGLKITISLTPKLSVTEPSSKDETSLAVTTRPDSGSGAFESAVTEGASLTGSYERGADGDKLQSGLKLKPKEVLDDPGPILKTLNEVSLGIDSRGLPTIQLSTAAVDVGGINVSYEFSG